MYEVTIKSDVCKGCQYCIAFCPSKHLKLSLHLNKRGAPFAVTVKENKCIGCGFCFWICPDSCIEVYEEKTREVRRTTHNRK